MTLVNTMPYFYRAYNQARTAFGYSSISFKDFLLGYLNESLSNPHGTDRFRFWLYFSTIFKTFKEEPVDPMPGAYSLLEFLKDLDIEVFVVTGRRVDKEVIFNELAKAGLDEFVEKVYTLRDINLSKPFDKTKVISIVLQESSRNECISIGDYSEDIVSTKINGCRPHGVAPFGKRAEILYNAGAIYVDRDLIGVKRYLEKIL